MLEGVEERMESKGKIYDAGVVEVLPMFMVDKWERERKPTC